MHSSGRSLVRTVQPQELRRIWFRDAEVNKLVVWNIDDEIPMLLQGSETATIRFNDVQGRPLAAKPAADVSLEPIVPTTSAA